MKRVPTIAKVVMFVLAFASVAAAETPAADNVAAASDWQFSLQGSWRYGSVDGYVQIPSGGESGTTSNHRPKLSEIGINNASIYDAEIDAAWRREQLYIGGQFIGLSGSDTLNTELISQANTFPAGTQVNSDVRLDWYRFGYRHQFDLLSDGSLTISPGIGAAVLDFSYKLHTSGGGGGPAASRTFLHVTPQISLNTAWRPWHDLPLSFELDLLGSPLVTSSIPGIFDEELLAKYHLINRPNLDLSGFVGVAFEQIRFHDAQTVPNRVTADFGPMLVLGLQFNF